MSDYRYNEFTGQYYPVGVTGEEHTVAFFSDKNAYGIKLQNAVYKESPSTVTITENVTGGSTYTEVGATVSPSAGQYRVSYDFQGQFGSAFVEFNSADNGDNVLVDYQSLGTILSETNIVNVAGYIGIGSIIWHTTHLTGSDSLATMRSNGFAVCDGTTAGSQGVTNPVITGTLPDLVTDGRWIRSSNTSGTLQDEQMLEHTHGVTDPGHTHGIGASLNASQSGAITPHVNNAGTSGDPYSTSAATTGITLGDAETLGTGSAAVNTGSELRVKNMSAIPMMRVR